MVQVRFDTTQLKELVKEAVVEALEQRDERLHEAVTEAIEDIALSRAIKEGDQSDFVSRDEVFAILEG